MYILFVLSFFLGVAFCLCVCVCVGVLWFCGSGILQRPPVSSPFFMEVLVVLTSLLCLSSIFFFFFLLFRASELGAYHIISIQSGSSKWVGFMCHAN
jgi:hypothetical protein